MIYSNLHDSSLVIPVLNEEDTLPHLFLSLKAQSILPREIIFVDCCSTDNSLSLIHQFICSSHGDLSVLQLTLPTSHRSAAAARNHGLIHASYEYVFFLDCGVQLFPDSFHLLYSSFNRSHIFLQSLCTFLTYPFQRPFQFSVCSSTYGYLAVKPSIAFSLCAKSKFCQFGAFNPSLVSGEDQELRARYRTTHRSSLPCSSQSLIEYSTFTKSLIEYINKQIYYQSSTFVVTSTKSRFRLLALLVLLLSLLSVYLGYIYLPFSILIFFFIYSFISPFLRSKTAIHFLLSSKPFVSVFYALLISLSRNFCKSSLSY